MRLVFFRIDCGIETCDYCEYVRHNKDFFAYCELFSTLEEHDMNRIVLYPKDNTYSRCSKCIECEHTRGK